MSKTVKNLVTEEYRKAFEGVTSACVVNVVRLDGVSTNLVRRKLHERNVRLQVVKNSLLRRAVPDGGLGPLARALDGPCALVTGGESIIDTAKFLVELRKTYPAIELKVGMLDGDPDLISVEDLAKMKSRHELLADLSGLLASPGRHLAGALNGPGGRLAGCFKAMAEKEEAAA